MQAKQPSKRYHTDLRIIATPQQVASSFFKSPAPKQVVSKQLIKTKSDVK